MLELQRTNYLKYKILIESRYTYSNLWKSWDIMPGGYFIICSQCFLSQRGNYLLFLLKTAVLALAKLFTIQTKYYLCCQNKILHQILKVREYDL